MDQEKLLSRYGRIRLLTRFFGENGKVSSERSICYGRGADGGAPRGLTVRFPVQDVRVAAKMFSRP